MTDKETHAAPRDRSSWIERANAYELETLDDIHRNCDHVFARLFVAQWVFSIGIALIWSPHAWAGKVHTTHLHVYYALFFGAALALPSLLLIRARPGSRLTRHIVAVVQMLWSALLIHLTGGRIETHFHVFGSLAFLAFYRDWRVLITATVAVAVEHLLRAFFWPESVYGVVNPEWWRFLEHAFWVLFENIVLVMGVRQSLQALHDLAERHVAREVLNESVESKVVERTAELTASREQYRLLVETTRTVPWELESQELRFTYVGPQIDAMLGVEADRCLVPGFFADAVHPDDRARVIAAMRGVHASENCDLECRMRKADGAWIWVRLIASVATGEANVQGDSSRLGGVGVIRGVLFDVSRNRELEFQLLQAQKLESVGRLASGVAHEINTPVQFVSDSVHFVQGAFGDVRKLLDRYDEVHRAVLAGTPASDAAEKASEVKNEVDLSYLVENVPKALDRSVDGLNRITEIVRSMKEFAHPDSKEMTAVDLNQAIRSTVTIARNEYKYVADVETELGELPFVTCHAGEVNQAILNIIVNAAHAIGDVVQGTEKKGRITIKTQLEGDSAVILIKDTGGGIPEAIRDRICDPFFTTKEVGKGTGQGLAIARSVILEKHGGDLTFESEVGKGTTFRIRLPVAGKVEEVAEGVA